MLHMHTRLPQQQQQQRLRPLPEAWNGAPCATAPERAASLSAADADSTGAAAYDHPHAAAVVVGAAAPGMSGSSAALAGAAGGSGEAASSSNGAAHRQSVLLDQAHTDRSDATSVIGMRRSIGCMPASPAFRSAYGPASRLGFDGYAGSRVAYAAALTACR